MSLKKYRAKRDFSKTKEPKGKRKIIHKKLKYVVQKHAASHLHYDFRLEMDGVLKSWAVPKGPCLDPTIKRLAVQVEDHPLEYASFEGIIPAGQYGGGTVMVWDHGYWISEGDSNKALQQGKLEFILHGEKLKGKWALLQMKKTRNWLLIKIKDKEAKSDNVFDITKQQPNSVLSNYSLQEIEQNKNDLHRV